MDPIVTTALMFVVALMFHFCYHKTIWWNRRH